MKFHENKLIIRIIKEKIPQIHLFWLFHKMYKICFQHLKYFEFVNIIPTLFGWQMKENIFSLVLLKILNIILQKSNIKLMIGKLFGDSEGVSWILDQQKEFTNYKKFLIV